MARWVGYETDPSPRPAQQPLSSPVSDPRDTAEIHRKLDKLLDRANDPFTTAEQIAIVIDEIFMRVLNIEEYLSR